ncbi:MAG: SagB/ThcOx family dehydrogenase [Candidatus Aminicenantes bacterium]|jgi:SagB-type dehydrogenase family enzyme
MDNKKDIGNLYQQETKYIRGKLSGGPLIWSAKPKTYKTYPDSPKTELEDPEVAGGMPIWEAIQTRQSIRNYKNIPLTPTHLSQLLWATQGISREAMGFEFRTAPSAGALYPVETYLVLNNVDGIEPGVYHYDVKNHQLDQLKRGDFRIDIARAALDQDMAYSAGVVFAWTALFERSKWKYKQRAYRYVYLDAGHIAENLALAAVALGLGTCQIGALYDDEVNDLIEIDGDKESILYMSTVGYPQ